jgi:outer membrane protein OmpA-like peptidoglycan-associated protein
MVWGALLATAQVVEVSDPAFSYARAHTSQTTAEKNRIKLQDILIHYENNIATPRWDYQSNQASYNTLSQIIDKLASDSVTVHTIIIEGAASPVGSEVYNNALALRRAEYLKGIISEMEGGDRFHIHTISMGEDWKTFSDHIHQTYNETNREEVLAILDSDDSNDEKERRLYNLDNGKTWRLLVTEYMAPARNAAVLRIVELEPLADLVSAPQLNLQGTIAPLEFDALPNDYYREKSEFVEPTTTEKPATEQLATQPTTTEKPATEQPTQVEKVTCEDTTRKLLFALRSNLLVPALNLGVEVPIGNHWSVGADYYYPWVWPKRDNKNCFEFLGWGIEGRYWFGRNRTIFDRLQGHSIGLYGYAGYYDFERNYHGHQGEFVNVGLDYTYAMAVGKRKQLHFEFSLGVGYIYSEARKYTVIEPGAPLISDKITRKIGFFGPTKANISLVVPIFQKVKPSNKAKGNE